MTIHLPRVKDFKITGGGDDAVWDKTDWHPLTRVAGHAHYASRAKLLYSATGIYALFDCEDQLLSCGGMEDFDDLYMHDVVEAFFWPNRKHPIYFEHELSPLDKELVLLVPNANMKFHGWRAWHYTGERRTRHATVIRGGKKRGGAKVTGWSAELFIPFVLLEPLGNTPPKRGTLWHGNLCRIDRDHGHSTYWSLSAKTRNNFHDFRNFAPMRFD